MVVVVVVVRSRAFNHERRQGRSMSNGYMGNDYYNHVDRLVRAKMFICVLKMLSIKCIADCGVVYILCCSALIIKEIINCVDICGARRTL